MHGLGETVGGGRGGKGIYAHGEYTVRNAFHIPTMQPRKIN